MPRLKSLLLLLASALLSPLAASAAGDPPGLNEKTFKGLEWRGMVPR